MREAPRHKDGRAKYFFQLCCLHGGMVAVLMSSHKFEFVIGGAQVYDFKGMWIQRSDQPAVKTNG